MEFWRLAEDCSMLQGRQPQMPEGQWLQCLSLEWTDWSPDAAERRCDRPAIELTGIQYLDRYEGADPWMHRRARTHSLKRTRSVVPRCQTSGAGDGWRQKRYFFEVAGGCVWQQHASYRTVEPEDSPVLWQGAHCNNPASEERGPWRERGMHHWWAFDGSYAADVCESTMYLSAWWREMPDSKTDPGRLLGCGLSWMEEWRTRWSRSTRTYTWPDDEPNQTRWIRFLTRWAWVGCSSSRPRYCRCSRQAWMWGGACRWRHSGRRSACHRHIHE